MALPGDWFFGGSSGGSIGSRERDPDPRYPIGDTRAGAPRNVRVDVTDISTGTFRTRWNDINLNSRRGQDTLIASWRVIYCSDESAGNSTGGEQFAERVLQMGLGIHETPARYGGDLHTYVHSDITLGNGWVVVAAVNDSGLLGYPSQPAFVRLESSTSALPYVTTNVGMGMEQRTVNGYDVVRLYPAYFSPSDMRNFHGVQLYSLNHYGDGQYREMGNMHVFQNSTGGQQNSPWAMDFPTPTQAKGTALFTNGSVNVVRASGDNFSAAHVGDIIATKHFSGDGSWLSWTVATFVDANNVTLSGAFTGTTQTNQFYVWNNVTYRFLAINTQGGRDATPATGNPLVSI